MLSALHRFTFAIAALLLTTFASTLTPMVSSEALAQPRIRDLVFTRGRLAFTFINKGHRDIYIVDFEVDHPTVTPVAASDQNEEFPDWSSDGKRIAYQSSEIAGSTERQQIWVMNGDGTAKSALTTGKYRNEHPSWSPDGSQIVFDTNEGSSASNIGTMNADGGGRKLLISNRNENSFPRWSPRSDEIAFQTLSFPGSDIALYQLAAKRTLVLTQARNSLSRVSWKPDGSALAFTYSVGGKTNIWMIEKGAREPKEITSGDGKNLDPIWTDDGLGIIYAGEVTPGRGDFQLFKIDIASRVSKQITEGEGACRHPSWTPLPFIASPPAAQVENQPVAPQTQETTPQNNSGSVQ